MFFKEMSEGFLRKYLLYILLGVIVLAIFSSIISSWIMFNNKFKASRAALRASYEGIDAINVTLDTAKTVIKLLFDKQKKLEESLSSFQETLYALRGPLQIESGTVSFEKNLEYWEDKKSGARRNVVRVTFSKNFSETPQILLSPSAIFQSTENEKFSFELQAIDITNSEVLRSFGKNYKAKDLELVV